MDKKILLILSICIASIFFITSVVAMVEFRIGDLLLVSVTNATTGNPITDATCNITVANNTVVAYENETMGNGGGGVYYWQIPVGLVAQPTQSYRAKAVCNVNGADWLDYMYFYVVDIFSPSRLYSLNETVTEIQTSTDLRLVDINDTVNILAQRNITQNLTESSIWNYPIREVNLTQNAFEIVRDIVWTSAARTLTSYGTLIADIWAYATRTLTSYGTLIADIWGNSDRTLTQNITQNMTATDVWEYPSRTLTQNITQNETGSGSIYYDNSTLNIILPADAI